MNSAADSVINVQGLGVERGETTILRNINWRVERGQHWAILGANGSGKTSLLMALTAYLTPSSGAIEVDGERYGQSDWSKLRKRIGLVSSGIARKAPAEETALKTVLSGASAQLGYWSRCELPEEVEQARECLARMEVEHLADRVWGLLSQGERQRVFIARALMTEPVLLILDEPCAGLDPAARETFLKGIQALSAQPFAPTLVLVTHHVEEIMPCFGQTLVLKDGGVLAKGPTDVVLRGELLSETFGAPIKIDRDADRWRMQVSV